MSLYFFVNNFHFAFGMIGAIVLAVAAWLSLDAYQNRSDTPILLRFLGLTAMSFFEVVHSLSLNSDLLSYFGFFLFLLGLIFIIISFLRTKALAVNAIVVIPAFSLFGEPLYALATIFLFIVAYLAFRQWKREFNRTWIPFSISFLLLGIASFFNIFSKNISQIGVVYILGHIIELLGFFFLGYWVWQYMRLRIKESFIMLSIGVTFILATIVTLAFSTILIGRINTETSNNLLTDVKVLSFTLDGMKEEALAKASLVAKEDKIIKALEKNDEASLDQYASEFLEKYKLGFLIITGKDGSVIVRAHDLSKRGDTLVGERALEEALLKNNFVTIEEGSVEGFSIRAGSPVLKENKVLGAVIAGFQMDNVLADHLKKLTGLEMFIYKDDVSVSSTVFDVDGITRLVGEKMSNADISNAVLNNAQILTGSSMIYGSNFHAGYAPITNGDEKVVGMLSVAKPEQDIINIANATNRLTLITVLLILLVLLFPVYLLSKKISNS